MQCNDLAANVGTNGLLTVGFDSPSLSEFEHCAVADTENGLDKDWFRVELQEGKTYLFNVTNLLDLADVAMSIFDDQGREKPNDDAYTFGFQQSFIRYSPRYTGTHFLEVGQKRSFYDYKVAAREITTNNIADNNALRLRSSNGLIKFDRIAAPNEVDSFFVRLKFSDDVQYRIVVTGVEGTIGGALAEPTIRIQESVATGVDGEASLLYQPTGNGFYLQRTVVVEGNGGSGDYRIAINSVDRAGVGELGSVRMPWEKAVPSELRTSRYAVAKNHFLDVKKDIDWFNVSLQAGKRYRFELTDPTRNNPNLQTGLQGHAEGHVLPALLLRDPNLQLIDIKKVTSFNGGPASIDFFAQQGGTYFLVARNANSGDVGEYRLTAREYKRPIIAFANEFKSQQRLLLIDDENRAVNELFDLGGLNFDDADKFELYSDAELAFRGEARSSETVYQSSATELEDWTFTQNGDKRQHNILVRAHLDSSWTPWMVVPVKSVSRNRLLNSGVSWDHDELVTFRFASELPTYYSSASIEGFQPVAEGSPLMFEMKEMLSRFYGSTNLRFREALPFEETADINIFLADNVESDYNAFKPGPDQGGDIILSSSSFSNELVPVDLRAQHQLLRASGETLGLNPVENVDWDKSLMGVEQASGSEFRFYPGLQDLVVLDQLYGVPSVEASTAILFHDASNTELETKRDAETIQAGNSFGSFEGRKFIVDLREGARSYVEINGEQTYTLVNAVNSVVQNVVGSQVEDFITGNWRNNNISGGIGDDWISGLAGDDTLNGDGGNDRFVYNFADGNDVISGGIGVDSLRLKERFGFSIETLAQDLKFKRIRSADDPREHDLLVELTLNGGSIEGSILLKQMSNTDHRTESLFLNDADGVLQKVSLVNLFSQVGFSRTQFDFADGTNDYGRLVTPV